MFRIEPTYEPPLRRAGIADARSVFDHRSIRVWRSIRERENATLDIPGPDGAPLRLHVKRDRRPQRDAPCAAEAQRLLDLRALGIPTAELVAWGALADGRSFVITRDLEGFHPADKLISSGRASFEHLLGPTAELAGRLHAALAFHRDLYLCHFFATEDGRVVRLIDCARVLIRPFWRRRWQVKDLAQFVYSTREHGVPGALIDRWFDQYSTALGGRVSALMRREIGVKAGRIARHDRRLCQLQPNRNVSIPG